MQQDEVLEEENRLEEEGKEEKTEEVCKEHYSVWFYCPLIFAAPRSPPYFPAQYAPDPCSRT